MLSLEHVAKNYRAHSQSVHVLRDVTVAVAEGARIAIQGANGSGKTTLLQILVGQLKPDSGTYKVDGLEVSSLNLGDLSSWRHERCSIALANMNRRAQFPERTWLGKNSNGILDRQLGIIRIEKIDGSPLALIVNYSMHGTTMFSSNLLISADAPGIVAEYVEDNFGAPMLFINGACGDLDPLYAYRDEFIEDNVVHHTGRPPDVGSKPQGASWVGALDMSSSLFEWTSSLYRPYPYDPSDGREVGLQEDDSSQRVFRGSAWYHPYGMHDNVSATPRFSAPTNYAAWYYGFRCARPFNP